MEAKPEGKSSTRLGWREWLVLGLFGFLWSAGTGSVDFILVQQAVRQYRAFSYDSVEGEVLKCVVTEKSDGEGTTYGVDIEYVYRVDNQEYRGKRVRHYQLWDHGWVTQFVQDHPPQTRVTVHYDPADPSDAVLVRDFDGGLAWAAMFLMPFNLVVVGFFLTVVKCWRNVEAPPFTVREVGPQWRVDLAPCHPAWSSLLALGAASFVASLFVACCMGMSPSITTAAIAWGFVLGCSALAFYRVSSLSAAGRYDLVLDRGQKKLTFPFGVVGSSGLSVPFADIIAVDVIAVPDKEGGQTWYAPTLRWRGSMGEVREAKITQYVDEALAQTFAAWIGVQVGLPTPPSDRPGPGA